MSVTDELSNRAMDQAASAGVRTVKTIGKHAPGAVKGAATKTISGIVLIFKATKFTTGAVMTAVGKMAGNPKYYSGNISIAELANNSDVKQMDEKLTKDEMKHLNSACKKFGIKYNAVVDKSNPKEPTYYVFFKGKEAAIIELAMKEAYKNYVKEQAKPRFSVKAKLAFFRDRVTARDKEQQNQDLGKERHNSRAGIQR